MTDPVDKEKFKESLDDLKETTSKLWEMNTTDTNRPPSKGPSLSE